MEKEKLINEIDLLAESIRTHIRRLKSHNQKVHKMDIDLLIDKTRQLYDQLISLDGIIIPFETGIDEESGREISDVHIEETVSESLKEVITEGISGSEEHQIETVRQNTEEEEHVEEIQKQPDPKVLKDEKATVIHEEQSVVEEERHTVEEKEGNQKVEMDDTESKSTIDLFSTSSEPTLGDRFKNDEQRTIADKITKEHINELREAIGINEKFLFINELFNGDLSRYNRIIDELDDLKTMEGVKTYMLELKIQSQWAEDNPAFIKLHELVNRKFLK